MNLFSDYQEKIFNTLKKLEKKKLIKISPKLKRITESGQNYTEETSKTSFILPLFEALGWDTTNAVADDEVTAEDNISGKRVITILCHICVLFHPITMV